MASSIRTIRSNAVPAGRQKQPDAKPVRPELHVITGSRTGRAAMSRGFERVMAWTRTRKAPMINVMINVMIAVVFLAACLMASLTLRTQMAQNSFDQAQVQQNISTLTQDVEDDQAKLDSLQAALPQQAQKMGMVAQQGSISIDLSGYHAEKGTKQ